MLAKREMIHRARALPAAMRDEDPGETEGFKDHLRQTLKRAQSVGHLGRRGSQAASHLAHGIAHGTTDLAHSTNDFFGGVGHGLSSAAHPSERPSLGDVEAGPPPKLQGGGRRLPAEGSCGGRRCCYRAGGRRRHPICAGSRRGVARCFS